MKTVILAGGLGTRLSEETANRPTPMAEVGGKPILRHLLDSSSAAGFDAFAIALGHKQEVVRANVHAFWAADPWASAAAPWVRRAAVRV